MFVKFTKHLKTRYQWQSTVRITTRVAWLYWKFVIYFSYHKSTAIGCAKITENAALFQKNQYMCSSKTKHSYLETASTNLYF